MVLEKPLDAIMGQASKIKLLRFMTLTNAEMNGSELAKSVYLSHVKCNMALQELSHHGIIIMRKIGKSYLYKLNKGHILYTDFLKPLFEKESNIFSILSDLIINTFREEKPLTLAVFGSNVKNTAKAQSDIDVLVIIPNKMKKEIAEKALDLAAEKIVDKFGNQLSPVIITQNEFKKKYSKKDSLIREIVKKNKVIYGKSIAEVL